MGVPMESEVPADGKAERGTLAETLDSLRAVARNPSLRRVQLALAGSLLGDAAYATAVTVWAFEDGGTKAVGLWAAIRLALMAVTAPFAAGLADRLPRKRVMIGADVARLALVAGAAGCIAADAPSAAVYVLATLTSMLGCAFRPAQAALLPSIAETPAELTASNGVSSTLESIAFFLGPALGAGLLALADIEFVLLLDASTFLWSALLIARVAARPAEPDGETDEPAEGMLREMFAGFSEIRRDRDLLLVGFLVSAQTVIAGASTVFFLLFAVDILDLEPEGVGYVDAILGGGCILGGILAISRSARGSLASDLAAGVILWSLPLLLVTASGSPAAVVGAVVVLGVANPLVDVNFSTVVQRIAPDRVLGRVFGALEGALIGGMALGAALMPFLVDRFGLRTSLAALALGVGLPALALLPAARRLDARLEEPAGLALLRSVPIFAPLAPGVLESVARRLERLPVAAGQVVVEEGTASDRFYLIESGRVAVTHDDELLRHEGVGEHFGEIGLLRDVPRTATVTAVDDTVLLCLERADFLDAVSSEADSRRALEDVVTYRLGF
jgi:MFS family permease